MVLRVVIPRIAPRSGVQLDIFLIARMNWESRADLLRYTQIGKTQLGMRMLPIEAPTSYITHGVRGAPTPSPTLEPCSNPPPKGSSVAPYARNGACTVRGGGRGLIPANAGVIPLLYPMSSLVTNQV